MLCYNLGNRIALQPSHIGHSPGGIRRHSGYCCYDKGDMNMAVVSVNFQTVTGPVKVMHAVNNGPIRPSSVEQTRGNFDTFRAAEIPYVRNHDASFCSAYGGEHTVDVHAIFPDFSKNPYDPASYDFTLTDGYTQTIIDAGSRVFYRLGTKIEHWPKNYGSLVPGDFHKWAVICEHIIRHYNEGWANGYRFNIEYWEIWNEPDGVASDGSQPNWSGTPEEYYELYKVAATHLKKRFPHLKIGGPSMSFLPNQDGRWLRNFLASLTENGTRVPLDFFSWHSYMRDPIDIVNSEQYLRGFLEEAGYTETESILNEYNYLEGWTDRFISSIEGIISMHGAAFTAAAMARGQASSVDMLMYYDASPSAFNGMFDFYTYRPLKGYYPFVMYSHLYRLGSAVQSTSEDENLYVTAARGEDGYAMMLTHYRKDKTEADMTVTVRLGGVPDGIWQTEILDTDRTMETCTVEAVNGEMTLPMPHDCVVLLKKEKI